MTAAELLYEIETDIMVEISRLLGKGAIGSARWKIEKLTQIGTLNRRVTELIYENLDKLHTLTAKDIAEKAFKLIDKSERRFIAAVKAGADLNEVLPLAADPSIRGIVAAWTKSADSQLNLTMQTLITGAGDVFRNTIEKTTAEVLFGAVDARTAMRRTIKTWADEGIPAIVDKAGRHWSPEAYASMIIRTNVGRATNEAQWQRADEYGVDLIEVSSHVGARPLCAPYQGMILSRSGNTEGYMALSETSYGEPAGLFGINCGHYWSPYIPGVSVPAQGLTAEQEKDNDRIYKESQEQRRLEREIRAAKREEKILRANGDPIGAGQSHEKVLSRQATMRAFIDETDRTRRYDREQVEVKG